jgi:hypothetical protein
MARFRCSTTLEAVERAEMARGCELVDDLVENEELVRNELERSADGPVTVVVTHPDGARLSAGSRLVTLVEDPDGGGGQTEELVVTVVALDRHGETVVRAHNAGTGEAELRLHLGKDGPRRVECSATAKVPEAGRFRRWRRLSGTAELDLDTFFDAHGAVAARALADNPLVRARLTVAARPSKGDDWQLAITVTITGRGLLRPPLAVALLLARPLLRRRLAAAVDTAAGQWRTSAVPWLRLPPEEQRRQLLAAVA